MEGAMEYLRPSFTEEMTNLEQEVGKELEEISHSFKTNTAQAIIREAEDKLLSLKKNIKIHLFLNVCGEPQEGYIEEVSTCFYFDTALLRSSESALSET